MRQQQQPHHWTMTMLVASRQRYVKQRHCNEEGNRWSQRSSMDDGSTIASFIGPKKSRICIENMPPSDRSTERSPASLRDEICRALSLRALDALHKKNSMKVCEQRQSMCDVFHGDKNRNVTSSVHQLSLAEDACADMFEDEVDQVLSREEDGCTKQLKTLCSRTENACFLGRHVDLRSLSETDHKTRRCASSNSNRCSSASSELVGCTTNSANSASHLVHCLILPLTHVLADLR